MKQPMVFSVLLGSALLGFIALGTGRSDAQSGVRPVKEDARAPQVDKVEANREVSVQQSGIVFEGAAVTEAEAAEISQALLGHSTGTQRPTKQEPSIQTVERPGGTLAILDRGDGVVHVVAFALDRENPDPGATDQGVAFHAVITKDGVNVKSVDTGPLARLVGADELQGEMVGAIGELPVQEPAIMFEGAPVSGAEAAEISQALREHLAGVQRPAKKEPFIKTVEMPGGNLAILDRGDGVIQLVAFAFNRENPNLQSGDAGVAFSAVITKEGVEVPSVDAHLLPYFIGENLAEHRAVESQGGVAVSPNESVLGPCNMVPGGACCVVLTNTALCYCCVGSAGSGCLCTQIPL